MIVADTGAVLGLLDRKDKHHKVLRALFEQRPERWILPWAILPEVDYVASSTLGRRVQEAFFRDLSEGLYTVDFGEPADLTTAFRLHARYRSLAIGLVDACVIAVAQRVRASAIATLDLRHFGVVEIAGAPKLFPRDLDDELMA